MGAQVEVERTKEAPPFRCETDGPGYAAARGGAGGAFGRPAGEAGSGGSIPLLRTLQKAAPNAEFILWGPEDSRARADPRLRRERRPGRDREDDRGPGAAAPAAWPTRTALTGGEAMSGTDVATARARCPRRHVPVDAGRQRQHVRGEHPAPRHQRRHRHVGHDLQWAVTGYSLVGAATIVTSGSLGDVFGRKRIFQLGLLLFIASCVLIALSDSGGMVIAGRCIQGASGATILACGLSLLTVATPGEEQAASGLAVGRGRRRGRRRRAAARWCPGRADGWQGLFWVDAGVAAVCMAMTAATVTESRDQDRPRSIDIGGSVLVALTLTPVILALSKGSDWGWTSVATLGCLAVAVVAGFAFVAVEKRVAVPMLDLALLRNRVLVASTIAILIGAGTINALMYLVSLYFQDPSTLGLSPLQAGLATLPATAGLVAGRALRAAVRGPVRRPPGRRCRVSRSRPSGFAAIGLRRGLWRYGAFVLPLIAVAVGMGLSNGPATSASTASRLAGPGRARPPASPTWPATSVRPWRRRSPRRSTAASSPTGPPRASRRADALPPAWRPPPG